MVPDPNPTSGAIKSKALTKKKVNEDLSDEDLALKQQLELYVERVQDRDPGLRKVAIESMRQVLRASASSMTSFPKQLKFLRPHYGTLKAFYETMGEFDSKQYLADILSVLAPTMSAKGKLESLKYRLLGSVSDIGSWGHEYVRYLAEEIVQLYNKEPEETEETNFYDLMDLVQEIVAFHMQHNAEPEAIDLLLEVDELDMIREYVDKTNFRRTCLYLTSLARYHYEYDELALDIAYVLYKKFEEYPNALRIALFIKSPKYVFEVFESCDDVLQKKQLCYILARHGLTWVLDEEQAAKDHDRFMLQDVINNRELSEGYLALARDIEVMEPKSPEDVYKAHLVDARPSAGASVDLYRLNLAATFVNAFVNAGFGQDKLMTIPSDSSRDGSTDNWLFKNKENGKTSAVASLGLILLWDVDSGLAQVDKYIHSNDKHVIAGALLGVGILNCNIKHDFDPAMALLMKYMNEDDLPIKIGAVMGLGITYAGSWNKTLRRKLVRILHDKKAPLDVIAFTAISLGLICVGSCKEEAVDAIISALMYRSESDLGEPLMRFLPLGLGLLYLGKEQRVDEIAEETKKFNKKIRKYSEMTLLSCAYAGSGHVLTVQSLLGFCSQHLDEGEIHQGPAVLGIAMVGMAEELGIEMAIRSLGHLLQYGEQNIRRAVPLALGLLCISNPKINVVDILSRLSRDTDSDVAMAAVISLGLIGAGTNNAQIAGLLRSLSSYYYNDTSLLFCVRIAQGLVHLGKGLLTLNPYHSDRFLLQRAALAGLITTLHACLDMKAIVLGNYHYVLYFLVLAMQPRMLITLDGNSKPLSVPVQVGVAVDVVGRAGCPKTITGFQTQSTPVLLGPGERAELATEKYIALSPILEGFVILKENPEYREDGGP